MILNGAPYGASNGADFGVRTSLASLAQAGCSHDRCQPCAASRLLLRIVNLIKPGTPEPDFGFTLSVILRCDRQSGQTPLRQKSRMDEHSI
jgi:hypothetical protein